MELPPKSAQALRDSIALVTAIRTNDTQSAREITYTSDDCALIAVTLGATLIRVMEKADVDVEQFLVDWGVIGAQVDP